MIPQLIAVFAAGAIGADCMIQTLPPSTLRLDLRGVALSLHAIGFAAALLLTVT